MFDFHSTMDGRFGWFLLTWHPEQADALEEIQTQIKLDIRNSAIGNTTKAEIETWLKSFFAEYHWKLHAMFRKTTLKEQGISLLLAVMYDHELFIVEFGRILCGVCDKQTLTPSGRAWNNFYVKSLVEMNLIGLQETEISVKPIRLFLAEGQRFVALPGGFAEKLQKQDINASTINTILPTVFEDGKGSYFILEGKAKLLPSRKRKLKPFHISAFTIIVVTLLAVLYMQFGNRFLESGARKLKLIITDKSVLRAEQIPQYLKIESESIRRQLKTIERIANQPARNVGLNELWHTEMDFLITAAPGFDFNNIYIASDNQLLAFDKKNKKLRWKHIFAADIREVSVIEGNLIVFLDNQTLMCLNRNNQLTWNKAFVDKYPGKQSLVPFEVTKDDDPRLNSSVLVLPGERGMYVYDVNSGYLLANQAFDSKMQFMSQYDPFDNCFYTVVAAGVHCISLDIKN